VPHVNTEQSVLEAPEYGPGLLQTHYTGVKDGRDTTWVPHVFNRLYRLLSARA
jgi:hypothetical protein